jgi:hypothetical protein
VPEFEGRRELTWTNKPISPLAHEYGTYEWVRPSELPGGRGPPAERRGHRLGGRQEAGQEPADSLCRNSRSRLVEKTSNRFAPSPAVIRQVSVAIPTAVAVGADYWSVPLEVDAGQAW